MSKFNKERLLTVIVTIMIILPTTYLLNQRYLNRVQNYVESSGTIYSWKYYKCLGDVMYSTRQSDTLMVNKDGSPKQCKIVMMTNREYTENYK